MMVDTKFTVKIDTKNMHSEIIKWIEERKIVYKCTQPESFIVIKQADRSWKVFGQECTFEFESDQDATLFALTWLR